MPSFDVVSEVDMQEVRNAVDQASRELATRFDFKGTDSDDRAEGRRDRARVRVGGTAEGRRAGARREARAPQGVVEGARLRQGRGSDEGHAPARRSRCKSGINDEKAREIGKYIKGLGLKGVQHQVQGDQLRVSGKKRDDLQTAIQTLKEHDFGIPLQFTNFRD